MSYAMKEQYTKGVGGSRKVNPKTKKKGGAIKAGASNPPTQKRTPRGKKAY